MEKRAPKTVVDPKDLIPDVNLHLMDWKAIDAYQRSLLVAVTEDLSLDLSDEPVFSSNQTYDIIKATDIEDAMVAHHGVKPLRVLINPVKTKTETYQYALLVVGEEQIAKLQEATTKQRTQKTPPAAGAVLAG